MRLSDAMFRRIREELLSRLSDKELLDYHTMRRIESRQDEILSSMRRQEDTLAKVSKRGWFWDFSSNVAGNAAYGAGTFVLGKLARLLLK